MTDSSNSAGTQRMQVVPENPGETTQILHLGDPTKTQVMQMTPESPMEATQILHLGESAMTQVMQVFPESSMETTQILRLDDSERTQLLRVIPDGSVETAQILSPADSALVQTGPEVLESPLEATLILHPGDAALTQLLPVVPANRAEAMPRPEPSSTEVTVPLRVMMPTPPPITGDPLATQAIYPQQTLREPLPEVAPGSLVPPTEPTAAPDSSSATQVLKAQPGLRPAQPEVMPPPQVYGRVVPLSSSPVEAAASRGPWVTVVVGLGLVATALGIWYLVDRKPAEAPLPVEVMAPAVIPALVPPGYQETFNQAQAGDVAAMRTLAAVYTYGLGVPVHREEGLRWYRKAAEAGSQMAAKEAKDLESTLKQPGQPATP